MSFLNKLYNNLDKTKVKLNTSIVSINYEKKIAITSNDEEIQYEYLINTIPLNHFLKLTESNEDKELNNSLSYNKVLVFNLGFEKKSDF